MESFVKSTVEYERELCRLGALGWQGVEKLKKEAWYALHIERQGDDDIVILVKSITRGIPFLTVGQAV